MIHVVTTAPTTRRHDKIPGYVVGGKTGTAQIWDPKAGAWLADTYNHTFVGFVGTAARGDHPRALPTRIPSRAQGQFQPGDDLERAVGRVAMDAISALDLPPLAAGATSTVAPTVPTQQPAMPDPRRPPPSTRP